jgi:quercetin dioxygenase-like cupin family protein
MIAIFVIHVTVPGEKIDYSYPKKWQGGLNLMEKKFIKNIEFSQTLELANLVDYQQGKIISLTFVQNEALSMTLFAFAKGEGVSTHSAPGDAMVYILDGTAAITIDGKTMQAEKGQVVVMPANIPHGVEAAENFKMLLTVVNK